VTAVAGALVNVARVPEKWLFPGDGPQKGCRKAGAYDYWLNSHQIMHVLVLCSLVFKYMGMAEDYRHRIELNIGCQ
jgi:predicted membrane channel-forming protein YqfA (hemolysin III family)